ncbi:AcrR family transcriptional regulator [Thermocatellispora tengchongensis]|uniref:AcrR family transcriptional regulator n=1 Tax=Thermocatellispora tengchongensis TaxID=1073253 RepID=A0A840NX95_9ACTN|nr:helix-turn-helix domain-containing protein [Thermocatellispora tengchongensis]MBB5132138.1 AcrR family transcriptional regulator [Thermocatellispora tengchongensis]
MSVTSGRPWRAGPRPGRRPTFEIADIAEAALAVGFRDLTMTAVAARLGVKHSSLYRHVPSRDDLLIAAMDLAVRRVEWPEPDAGWRVYLERTGDTVWEVFAAHPGMAERVRELPRTPPAVIRLFYKTAHALTGFGFPPRLAVLAVDSVVDLAADVYVGYEQLSRRHDVPEGGTAGALDLLRESWAARPEPESAALAEIVREVIEGDPREWYRAKLALLLDGTATRL